jgi:hypothetical protein
LNIHQILEHLTLKNLTFNVFVSNRPKFLDHLTLEILNISPHILAPSANLGPIDFEKVCCVKMTKS